MDTFFELNRHKVKFAFVRISLAFLGLVSIFLTIAHFTGNLPSLQLLLAILFTSGIGFPILIMLVTYLAWQYKRGERRRMFSKPPFDLMKDIGFYTSYSKVHTKWHLTEEIREAKMNGFTLTMDMSEVKNYVIEIEIATQWKKLDKSEYKQLVKKFKHHNVEFRIGSLVKQYDTKQLTFKNITDIKTDLESFTKLLRDEGFQPPTRQGRA